MAKVNTVFVCSNCGNESPKWFGKCPACNEWNTCYEEKVSGKVSNQKLKKENKEPTLLKEVKNQDVLRTSTGFAELDRVLRRRISKRFFSAIRTENLVLESQL